MHYRAITYTTFGKVLTTAFSCIIFALLLLITLLKLIYD